MGVYIKGMEMPKNCMLCSFCVEEADPANGEMCLVTGKLMPPCNHERLDDCPLVEVPPHGRLIDADALMLRIQEYIDEYGYDVDEHGFHSEKWCAMKETEMAINDAPTVIPADKEDET